MPYRYQITVSHAGLGKVRILTGSDTYIVESRARELKQRWDEQYERKLAIERRTDEREQRSQHLQENQDEARQRTDTASSERRALELLLTNCITSGAKFDWQSLKDQRPYPTPPPLSPVYKVYPFEPSTVVPNLSFFDKIIPGRTKRKQEAASAETALRKQLWVAQVESIRRENELLQSAHVKKTEEWQEGKSRHDALVTDQQRAIDEMRAAYESAVPTAITALCEAVLSRTTHAMLPSPDFDLDYTPASKSLIVEYSLPAPDQMPRIKEVRFVKTRDELVETFYSDADQSRLYDSVVYQICLRVLRDLFSADSVRTVEAITFNGWVTAVDPAKGKETTTCIMSITARRDEFLDINLERIDPKACFKSLRGIGSSKLHSIIAIAPICTISREDTRFVTPHDVAETLAEGFNLATMEWEEFEHLIREVFAKEFSANGGEVKVTQASRDGGVDAVAFDPDPIRGGKIVIQAKRYTHTVGVSAVRDLYGTVLNEGATKGILVTTADYGPDAYQFAAGKPLSLLNGANLLHLLEKHGHAVRIDLREARRIAADQNSSA
ncbi:MAG: restriction system protein [Verrucomicrobiota bacterium]|jgi:restriction system protein